MVHVVLDYETRSEADLPDVGSYVYATHPSTEILCVAWRWAHSKEELETAPTHSWSPAFKREADADFLALLDDPKVVKVAHNALFEQLITRFVLPKYTKKKLREIPPSEWICTASLAATHALPRALEGAAKVLGCSVQKDMEGSRLIKKYCKPRKPTKNNQAKWHKKVSELKRIIEYCVTDIGATVGVFLALPPLIPTERKVWELDQVINIRGFYVDRDLVREALRMVEIETARLVKECEELTGGLRPSQRGKILAWVHRQGFKIPDLKSKTLERELRKKDVPTKARALLEIRQAVSKTSTAKYVAFRNRTSADGRLRDTKLYHGASTGRDAGRGVQPTNFPRGTLGASADDAAAVVKTGDIEMLRLLYGNPLDTLSSCLRSVIEATPGYEMSAIDWNAIEVRVLFWIADHAEGLQAYAEKRDLYREMACRIYNKILDEISKEEREVGKRAVLGCLAEDTLVFTSKGYRPIQEIKESDEIWNGKRFVSGLIAIPRGSKTVIQVGNTPIFATPEHRFLTKHGWQCSGEIAIEEATLRRRSARNSELWWSPRENLNAALSVVSEYAVLAELKRISGSINFTDALDLVRDALSLEMGRRVEIQATTPISFLIAVLENAGEHVISISGKGVKIPVIRTTRGMAVRAFVLPSNRAEHFWNTLLRSLGLMNGVYTWTELITSWATKSGTYESSLSKLASKTVETYDLSNVPETNAFMIEGGILAHNCGYQMGGEKFQSSLLEQYAMEIERELADTAVVAYRELHGPVKKLWGRLERAAITATQNPGKRYSINHTKWWVSSRDDRNRFLYCELPSGRRLAYYGPSIRWEKRTKKVKVLRQGKEVEVRQPYGNKIPKLYHWSVHPKTNQWVNGATYGGRLTENVVQGTARDVMVETMLKAEGPWRMLLTVYDELVTESKKGTRKVSELEKLAEIPPKWAPGLPLKAGGWTGERYRKG